MKKLGTILFSVIILIIAAIVALLVIERIEGNDIPADYHTAETEEASQVATPDPEAPEESESSVVVTVGPELVDCVGVAPQQCMIVNDEYWYDEIEGFEFESGYSYELSVERIDRQEPIPTDIGSWYYRLVEIISQTPTEKASTDAAQTLVGTTWVWLDNGIAQDDFTITFNDDNSVSGTTDCNNFFGEYGANDTGVSIGPLASTKMYCPDSREYEFTSQIEGGGAYTLEGDILTLYREMSEIRFQIQ